MHCTACNRPMEIENQSKESGFWFLWYRCGKCNEGYLHKSPITTEPEFSDEEAAEDPIAQQ